MHFPFCSIEILDSFADLASLFRQRTFHYVSRRAFHDDSREEAHFFIWLIFACINTYLHAKFKKKLSGEECKINKSPSLSIKSLKNLTPRKDGKSIFFQI